MASWTASSRGLPSASLSDTLAIRSLGERMSLYTVDDMAMMLPFRSYILPRSAVMSCFRVHWSVAIF